MMVYVRWYGKVVEGTVVKEQDKFGMVAVCIPIQGVHAVALFHPDHVYNNVQAASYGVNNKIVTQEKNEELKDQVREKLSQPATLDEEYEKLQKFKEQHWNHEKNILDLEYWEEYDKMYHAYQRKRRRMMQAYKPQHEIKMEYPQTEEDVYQYIAPKKQEPLQLKDVFIPSSGNAKPTFFKELVQPRTIGKQVKVTELSLF